VKSGGVRGIILDEGYHQDAAPRGTIVQVEMKKSRELPMVDGSARADAAKRKRTAAIRQRVVAAIVRKIAEVETRRDEQQWAVVTLLDRVMNDDRRGLCKAMGWEAKKLPSGSSDFVGSIAREVNGETYHREKAFLVLAVACVSSVRYAGKHDPLTGLVKRLKIDVEAIESDVLAGTKTGKKTGGAKTATVAGKVKARRAPRQPKGKARA
jgi:hypothetical protein